MRDMTAGELLWHAIGIICGAMTVSWMMCLLWGIAAAAESSTPPYPGLVLLYWTRWIWIPTIITGIYFYTKRHYYW